MTCFTLICHSGKTNARQPAARTFQAFIFLCAPLEEQNARRTEPRPPALEIALPYGMVD
jgi:hypothetical protein